MRPLAASASRVAGRVRPREDVSYVYYYRNYECGSYMMTALALGGASQPIRRCPSTAYSPTQIIAVLSSTSIYLAEETGAVSILAKMYNSTHK